MISLNMVTTFQMLLLVTLQWSMKSLIQMEIITDPLSSVINDIKISDVFKEFE